MMMIGKEYFISLCLAPLLATLIAETCGFLYRFNKMFCDNDHRKEETSTRDNNYVLIPPVYETSFACDKIFARKVHIGQVVQSVS